MMNTNEEKIRQLLDKYWNCETSTEEEKIIADYFKDNSDESELDMYSAYFQWLGNETKVKSGQKHAVLLPHSSIFAWFYPAVKVAAAVLLLLTVSIGFYTHFKQEQEFDRLTETYSDPEDALRKTRDVIEKVSSVLQLVEDNKDNQQIQVIDSLKVIKSNIE
jgi:hypothetical protein